MKRAERQNLVIQGERVFQKAEYKFQDLLAELSQTEQQNSGNLEKVIHDAVRNLNRKIGAYLDGNLDIKQLIAEFEFEKEALSTELRINNNSDIRIRRFSRKLLASIGDFIKKSGLGNNRSSYDQRTPRSKTLAYVLWLIGGFGTLGLHRFYLGKTGTGIAWILTGGLFFMGALYDLFALKGMVQNHNSIIELNEMKRYRLNSIRRDRSNKSLVH